MLTDHFLIVESVKNHYILYLILFETQVFLLLHSVEQKKKGCGHFENCFSVWKQNSCACDDHLGSRERMARRRPNFRSQSGGTEKGMRCSIKDLYARWSAYRLSGGNPFRARPICNPRCLGSIACSLVQWSCHGAHSNLTTKNYDFVDSYEQVDIFVVICISWVKNNELCLVAPRRTKHPPFFVCWFY